MESLIGPEYVIQNSQMLDLNSLQGQIMKDLEDRKKDRWQAGRQVDGQIEELLPKGEEQDVPVQEVPVVLNRNIKWSTVRMSPNPPKSLTAQMGTYA